MKFYLFLIIVSAFVANVYSRYTDEKVLQTNIQSLVFQKDKMTNYHRTSPISQLTCTGGTANRRCSEVTSIFCKNIGSSGTKVNWDCSAHLSPEIKLGKTVVSCEGYTNPTDAYVTEGSCGVKFELDYDTSYTKPAPTKTTTVITPVETVTQIKTYVDTKPQTTVTYSDRYSSRQSSEDDSALAVVLTFWLFVIVFIAGLFLLGTRTSSSQTTRGNRSSSSTTYSSNGYTDTTTRSTSHTNSFSSAPPYNPSYMEKETTQSTTTFTSNESDDFLLRKRTPQTTVVNNVVEQTVINNVNPVPLYPVVPQPIIRETVVIEKTPVVHEKIIVVEHQTSGSDSSSESSSGSDQKVESHTYAPSENR
jgi:hypothetical protein